MGANRFNFQRPLGIRAVVQFAAIALYFVKAAVGVNFIALLDRIDQLIECAGVVQINQEVCFKTQTCIDLRFDFVMQRPVNKTEGDSGE